MYCLLCHLNTTLDRCFFFSSRRRHTRYWRDWNSDVCSSDLRRSSPESRAVSACRIHEYQGKQILREYGMPTPRGFPAMSVEEAVEAAKKLGGKVWVVKAQIHRSEERRVGKERRSRGARAKRR